MRFLHKEDLHKELTYEDVFLVPQYSEIDSRMDVDLSTADGVRTTLPIVVSNMTAVAGKRMAEAVTRRGGLVVLPQDYTMEKIEIAVKYIKSRHPVFETPVVLGEDESIQTALNLIYKRSHGAIVVVDKKNKPVGIFVERDASRKDLYANLKEVMSKDIISMDEKVTPQKIFEKLQKSHVSIMPIVKKTSDELLGVMTEKSAVRSEIYKPATNKNGEFLTAVAIGINRDLESKTKELIKLGVDVFVVDTAHGHQKNMIEAVKAVRKLAGKDKTIVAGNVTTEKGTEDLIEAGANIVKVGVGPGAMCTTRMMTGVGRPQFSAVYECAKTARRLGAHVWADGGIRHPRDIALAIAAGASSAMFASWFAGTYESAADVQKDEKGRLYKESFGMASKRAVENRAKDENGFARVKKQYFDEGVSHSKMYLKEGDKSVEDIIDSITAGLRSACAYSGAKNLEELHKNALVGVQTNSGFKEGRPLKESW